MKSTLRLVRFNIAVVIVAAVAATAAVLAPSSAGRGSTLTTGHPQATPAPSSASLAADNARAVAAVPTSDNGGFWVAWSNGLVTTTGDAVFHGDASSLGLSVPIVGMVSTPDGGGYWLLSANGGVLSYGDAQFYGSAGGLHLPAPANQIVTLPNGGGYRLFAEDGGVFDYGRAGYFGSAYGLRVATPITGGTDSSSGSGYWMAASGGGVFSFGDAAFHGSASPYRPASPVRAIAATSDDGGYWLLTSAGGVFNFGDAGFYGAATDAVNGNTAIGIVPDHGDNGYWIVLSDGQVLAYGQAPPVSGEQVSGSNSPGYAFEVTNSAGQPARWDPCDTVTYAVVTAGAPDGWAADVSDDIDQAAAATGLTFDQTGTYGSSADVPQGVDLTISWASTLPDSDPLGATDYWYYDAAGYTPQIMSAQIELAQSLQAGSGVDGEQPVLLHELGHALGLAQSAGSEAMNPEDQGYTSFQGGDLAGLERLGSAQGCSAFYS